MKVIRFYSSIEKNFWLSNFCHSPITLDGKKWQTVEAYYQAQKTLNPDDREKIRLASTPAEAKKIGKIVSIVHNWTQMKDEVMLRALREKFAHEPFKSNLMDTGDALLEENSPTDVYWGRLGKNRLGELLMKVREELRNATSDAMDDRKDYLEEIG